MRATQVRFQDSPQGDNPGQQLYHARAEQLGELGLPGCDEALSGMGGASLILDAVFWIVENAIHICLNHHAFIFISDTVRSVHGKQTEILIIYNDLPSNDFISTMKNAIGMYLPHRECCVRLTPLSAFLMKNCIKHILTKMR